MKRIKLDKGYSTMVDNEDYDQLMKYAWHAKIDRGGRKVYAVRSQAFYKEDGARSSKTIRMHRVLLGINEANVLVDHKDHNGLNNQKSNLRICDKEKNSYNTRKRKGCASIYKGVSWEKDKWRSAIQFNKKIIRLGRYEKEIDAAIAYNNRAIELFGEFANINKI